MKAINESSYQVTRSHSQTIDRNTIPSTMSAIAAASGVNSEKDSSKDTDRWPRRLALLTSNGAGLVTANKTDINSTVLRRQYEVQNDGVHNRDDIVFNDGGSSNYRRAKCGRSEIQRPLHIY